MHSWGLRAALHRAPEPSADPLLSHPPGLLSVIELSAQSIIYEVSVVAFMVRIGVIVSDQGSLGTAQYRHSAKISSSKSPSSPSALKPLPPPACPSYGDVLN